MNDNKPWESLTVNERRYRYSPMYCGYIKTVNGRNIYNYYGYIGNLQMICNHVSEITNSNVPYGTVRRRIERGVPLMDAVSGPFYNMIPAHDPKHKCKALIVFDGVPMSVTELAVKYGVRPNTLIQRLRRGWSIEEAVGLCTRSKEPRLFCVDDNTGTIDELCFIYKISPKTVRSRLSQGWDISSSFKHPYCSKSRRISGTEQEVTYEGNTGSLFQMCKKYGIRPQSVYYRMNKYGLSKNEAFVVCVKGLV